MIPLIIITGSYTTIAVVARNHLLYRQEKAQSSQVEMKRLVPKKSQWRSICYASTPNIYETEIQHNLQLAILHAATPTVNSFAVMLSPPVSKTFECPFSDTLSTTYTRKNGQGLDKAFSIRDNNSRAMYKRTQSLHESFVTRERKKMLCRSYSPESSPSGPFLDVGKWPAKRPTTCAKWCQAADMEQPRKREIEEPSSSKICTNKYGGSSYYNMPSHRRKRIMHKVSREVSIRS